MTDAVVIGSGFAGLAAACGLAKSGWSVTVLEKNDQLGGRARVWQTDGFTFDMGPSWYWMPDVFEAFFARFDRKPSDYYDLVRLDPSYRVLFGAEDVVDLPASRTELRALFETLEPGAGTTLRTFLDQAEFKYRVGMNDYVRRPSLSLTEFADARIVYESARLQMVQSMDQHLRRYFKTDRLRRIMEFPVLFLGGTAKEIPAMYSLMNYADIVGGTWYPMGGLRRVIDGIIALAESLGVRFVTGAEALRIVVRNGKAVTVRTAETDYPADVVVAGADYHHVEQHLLEPEYRTYDETYWNRRLLSPSSLLFYLGVNRRLSGLLHHNLFFDEGLTQHAREIYDTPRWPTKPLFYACCPTQTDPSVAPEGCENLFLLMPVAPGLTDTGETRERYYHLILERLERITRQSIREHVTVKRSYAHNDFVADYRSYKGNAYGLANTLNQTAFFKPTMKPRKVSNLYYCGQLTVPGPGVPPSLISGEIVSDLIGAPAR
ncbi:MAG: phytoene desaturase family protein [Capsulimonadales bacterium]|nr:phytoene desaturase family protein [Capsulimonadales bacterium]